MTQPVATVLVLLLVALVLFATEKIPIDIVTILLVIGLVLTGTLDVSEAFAGFGNDIVITIAGLFVLTGGLVKTGVVDLVGRRLHRIAGGNEFKLTALVMFTAAACASVMKNTTTTAMFVPVVLGIAHRARVQPSKLLMPLAFGAILGGTCTLIGTSTNLAVSGALAKLGRSGELASQFGVSQNLLAPFSMFELTPVGIAIVAVGMLYMLAVGLRLLPSRGLGDQSLVDQYQMREYISEVIVLEDSPLVGKTLAEGNLREMLDLTVIGILRGKQNRLPPRGEEVLQAGDLLLVQGRMEDILRVKDEAGIEIRPDFELTPGDIARSGGDLYEVMVLRGSDLTNRTLRSLNFRDRYDLTVLAINRHGMALLTKLSTVTLRFGDVLLVQGEKSCVERLTSDGHVLMLEGELGGKRERADKRIWAALAFVVFLSFSVMHLPQVPLAVAVLLGVLILLASRAVVLQEVYDLIDWRLIVLIAGMISFGTAMEKSHADQYLADIIVNNFSSYGALAVLAGFFAMTVALTQPMSNQAAALVVLPIAVKTALALGLNPRTFAVAVTYAASCSFLTPLEPACVLIYTPGRYRFLDFVKVGSILTVAVFAIVMLLVPYFWPLR
ncbi:MAG TPA: SLC13 family permease [Pyrinomonadaceae bacterium]|jgi:di/tricarboxylate transporter|nr:SLC13 family permease [Pyrinomonadaceae bacterium]